MSMISMYESRLQVQRRELEKQRKKQADEETKAARADGAAVKAERSAATATGNSQRGQKLRDAERERANAAKARETAAKASQAVAACQKKMHEAEDALRKERLREQKKEEDRRGQRERQAERERQRTELQRKQQQRQDEQQKRNAEAARAREERARESQVRELERRVAEQSVEFRRAPWLNAPEDITVLFIAASPEGLEPLRLAQEVREIQQRVRESDYRDKVRFEWRPAARTTDLLQALNEVRPDVVHFSGHGNQDALAFEDADGLVKPLANDHLAALLQATSDRIRLAVFNSCHSASQAALACGYLDAAIGMNESIADEAAKTFAGQFYNSLGFGRSLAEAFHQACLQVELAHNSPSGEPQLHVAVGMDASNIFLVAPQQAVVSAPAG